MTPILIDHINEKGGGTPANIYQAEFPLELLPQHEYGALWIPQILLHETSNA